MAVMAFATLPKERITEGSGVFTLMRNFGASLFIAVIVVTVIRSTGTNYSMLTEFITPYNELMLMSGWPDAWSTGTLGGLVRLTEEVQRQAAMIGYVNAFYLMAASSAVAVPLAFLMRLPARVP